MVLEIVHPPGQFIFDLAESKEIHPLDVQIALELEIDESNEYNLRYGRISIDQDLAQKLEKLLNIEAEYWLAEQKKFDEWKEKIWNSYDLLYKAFLCYSFVELNGSINCIGFKRSTMLRVVGETLMEMNLAYQSEYGHWYLTHQGYALMHAVYG